MFNTKLVDLFKKISFFYKKAISLSFIKIAQNKGENDLYFDIRSATKGISEPEVIDELLLISELYKYAIDIGQGFYSVNIKIKNLFNMLMSDYPDILDESDSGENSIEDTLNKVIADLKIRAGSAAALRIEDNPAVKRKILEKSIQIQKEQISGEDLDEPSVFEMGLGSEDMEGGYQKPSEEGSDFGSFVGGGGGKDSTKQNIGYSVQKKRTYKDWVECYNNKSNRYLDNIEGEKNLNLISKTKELVEILKQLAVLVGIIKKYKDQLNIAPDPVIQNKFDSVKEKFKSLNEEKKKIEITIRRYHIVLEQMKLQKVLEKSSNENERFLLEQKIALKEVLSSRDSNKGLEIKKRRELISMIEGKAVSKFNKNWVGGGMPSGETLSKILVEIENAKKQRIPIKEKRKEEYEKLLALKATGELDGLVLTLNQGLANVKMGIKKDLVEEMIFIKIKEEEYSSFKDYLDALDNAIKTKQKAVISKVKEKLKEAMMVHARNNGWYSVLNKTAEKVSVLVEYNANADLYRNYTKNIIKFHKSMEKSEELNLNNVSNIIASLINEGENLINNQFHRFESNNKKLLPIIEKLKSLYAVLNN